jgi:hypothetical protein
MQQSNREVRVRRIPAYQIASFKYTHQQRNKEVGIRRIPTYTPYYTTVFYETKRYS